VGDVRKAHRILVEKPVGRQQLGKSSRLENVIKWILGQYVMKLSRSSA
jgi:hypothetical protein